MLRINAGIADLFKVMSDIRVQSIDPISAPFGNGQWH
jgi:hypothetical protein